MSVSSQELVKKESPQNFFARLHKGEVLPTNKQFRGLKLNNTHAKEEMICDCCSDDGCGGDDCCGFN